jgi:broad specificity phosphatase PhoE
MLTFYLIRHGLKEETSGDPPLSDLGKIQAKLTAEFLKSKTVLAIYASPYQRTRETAEIIGRALKLKVNFDKRLEERLTWGQRQGESFEEFIGEWVKTDWDREYVPPNGQSSAECGRRFAEALREIGKIYSSGGVVIVSHGGAIGDVLRNLFPEQHLPHRLDEKNGVKYIHVSECSVTKLIFDRGNYRLISVSETAHLPEPVT